MERSEPSNHGVAPKTVLVVDASPSVLRVAEVVLSEGGYRPMCVDHAGDFVTRARAAGPALILLASEVGEHTSFELCQLLGDDEVLMQVPVVIMDHRGVASDRFLRDLGVVDYIAKPFAPEALLAVVEHTLRKSRSESGTRRRMDGPPPKDPAAARLAVALAVGVDRSAKDTGLVQRLQEVLENPALRRDLDELLWEREGGPSLFGDLAAVPVAEVFQLLSLQRQTGFLLVRRGEAELSIAFKDGMVRLVTGSGTPPELLLGNILVQDRLMEPRELELLLANRRGTRRRLGSQMVKLGYVNQEQLQKALTRQSAELVYELLRWKSGRFGFERRDKLPPQVVEFEPGLRVDELLMEGFRRVDEWGLIETALPSFDVVLVRPPPPGELDSLRAEERDVLAAVDGRRTVHDIIRVVGWGTFAVARILYRLISAHWVTVRDAAEPAPRPRETSRPTETP